MSKCAAGCGFYAKEGSIYCSKHFNELASPEEKAQVLQQLELERAEEKRAKDLFDRAINGPEVAAKDLLQQCLQSPKFKQNWIYETIVAAQNLFPLAIQRVINLSTCEGIQYENRMPILALLDTLLNKKVDPTNPLVVQLVNHPLVTPDKLDLKLLNNAIYRHGNIHMIELLLTKAIVTKELVESARYSCKRPANVPTPEKLEIVKLIETKYQEQHPDITINLPPLPPISDPNEDIPVQIIPHNFVFLEESENPLIESGVDIWTCGVYPKGIEGTPSPNNGWKDQYRYCLRIHQLYQSYKSTGSCFYLTKENLLTFGISENILTNTLNTFAALLQLPVLTNRKMKNKHSYSITTKTYDNTKKYFFPSRMYAGYSGNEEEEDPEKANLFQNLTQAFKEAIDCDYVIQCNVYCSDADQYSPNIYLIGKTKFVEDGLVILRYEEMEQDHIYYGSL